MLRFLYSGKEEEEENAIGKKKNFKIDVFVFLRILCIYFSSLSTVAFQRIYIYIYWMNEKMNI